MSVILNAVKKPADHESFNTSARGLNNHEFFTVMCNTNSKRGRPHVDTSVLEKLIANDIKTNPDITDLELRQKYGLSKYMVNRIIDKSDFAITRQPKGRPRCGDKAVLSYIYKHPDATVYDVSSYTGLCTAKIRRLCKEKGIKLARKKRTPSERTREILDFIHDNPDMSQADIAKKFGVVKSYISTLASRH